MLSIRKQSGEVVQVDTEEILDAADLAAIVGREDDPVVQALITEIRRLGTVLANQPAQLAPVVHVSPSISAPAVNVSPRVEVTAPQRWHVAIERNMGGPLHGTIKSVEFIAVKP